MQSRPGCHRLITRSGARRSGWLRGPSAGLEAWTVYLMEVVDWMIDARRRWHEAGPRPSRRWSALAGGGACLLTLTLLVLRVLGG